MSNLAPPPLRNAVIDSHGLITNQWSSWLTNLYLRIGGGSAPTPDDVSAMAALVGDDSLGGQLAQLSRDIEDAKAIALVQDTDLLPFLNALAARVDALEFLSAVREMNPVPADSTAIILSSLS